MKKLYYALPAAACVVTLPFAPVTIHAVSWTQEFPALKNIPLDYTFTIEFNEMPTEQNVKDIRIVDASVKNIKFDKEKPLAYVTAENLTYNTNYEVQVFLTNGQQYKLDFTTADATSSMIQQQAADAMRAFLATTTYIELTEAPLHTQYEDLLWELELAQGYEEEIEALEIQLSTLTAQLYKATTALQTIDTLLNEAQQLTSNAPFEQQTISEMYDDLLWDLENAVPTWQQAAHIDVDAVKNVVTHMKQLSITNPYTDDLQQAISEAQQAIAQFSAATPYPAQAQQAFFVQQLEQAITNGTALLQSDDTQAIDAATEALFVLLDDSDYYIEELANFEPALMLQQQVIKALTPWQRIAPAISTTIQEINALELAMQQHLKQSATSDALSDALFDWHYALEDYELFMDDTIMTALDAELDIYVAALDRFYEQADFDFLDSAAFIAFETALDNASAYDMTNYRQCEQYFTTLKKKYTAIQHKLNTRGDL